MTARTLLVFHDLNEINYRIDSKLPNTTCSRDIEIVKLGPTPLRADTPLVCPTPVILTEGSWTSDSAWYGMI